MHNYTNLNCMVKEDTMHSLPNDIHSSKGEGKIGEASTHASTCKYILYKREHNTVYMDLVYITSGAHKTEERFGVK